MASWLGKLCRIAIMCHLGKHRLGMEGSKYRRRCLDCRQFVLTDDGVQRILEKLFYGEAIENKLVIEPLQEEYGPNGNRYTRFAVVWNNYPRREIIEGFDFDPEFDPDYGRDPVCAICGRDIPKGADYWREFSTLSAGSDVANPHSGQLYHSNGICVVEKKLADVTSEEMHKGCMPQEDFRRNS